MALLKSNAVVAVLRTVFNAGTKQTAAPAVVPSLAAVPVFVDEIGNQLRARGLTPLYEARMFWDRDLYDIRGGDQITGYNPTRAAVPPIYLVDKPSSDGIGTRIECGVAFLVVLAPPGWSS